MPRILLVEDDADCAQLMRDMLELEGYDVAWVVGGVEALRDLCDPLKPSALVVDLQLPGMSGAELVQRLREDGATARLPVVVTTGMEPGRYELPRDVPVLRKPFVAEDLLRVVDAVRLDD